MGTRATRYTGSAGVPISNLLRKAAFASRFGDWNLFWSGQVTSKSRVLYVRNIKDRVSTAAPFLRFDADPYPVVINGRILWMIDAYTTSSTYPYARSYRLGGDRINYMRNSVKVVIDAYDGATTFYVADSEDPVIAAYRSVFPTLLKDISAMPP